MDSSDAIQEMEQQVIWIIDEILPKQEVGSESGFGIVANFWPFRNSNSNQTRHVLWYSSVLCFDLEQVHAVGRTQNCKSPSLPPACICWLSER